MIGNVRFIGGVDKGRRQKKCFFFSLRSKFSLLPSPGDQVDMQQVEVQLENAKIDQRIHKRVPSRVPFSQRGGGRSNGGNALLRNVGMSDGRGGGPSIVDVLCMGFDGIKIMIIRGWTGS